MQTRQANERQTHESQGGNMNTHSTHYQSPDVSRVTLQELPLRACWSRPAVLWVDVIGKYSFMAVPSSGTRDPCPRLTPVSLSCLSICTHGNASPGTQEPCPATHLCGPVMSIDAGPCQLEAPPDLLSKKLFPPWGCRQPPQTKQTHENEPARTETNPQLEARVSRPQATLSRRPRSLRLVRPQMASLVVDSPLEEAESRHAAGPTGPG